MNRHSIALAVFAAGLAAAASALAAPGDIRLAQGWYGPPHEYHGGNRHDWAVGTFYGRNGANGSEETITIQPDGSAEVRTPGEAPKYGTFAGETLTVGSRMSKVQPARGGIVIDGAYYRR